MSTHDYNIANASGASVRQDINNALAAILSNNSNESEPSTKEAYMTWVNNSSGIDSFNIRNSGNSNFVEVFRIDGTHIKLTNVSVLALEDGTASSCALSFNDDLNTGIFSSAADTFNVATAGVERLELKASETVFNEDGADTDFRVEGSGEANLFFIDAANQRIGLGTGSPTGKFHIKSSAPTIYFEDTGANGSAVTIIEDVNGFFKIRNDASNVGTGSGIGFEIDSSEKMRIDSTGKIGIGDSDPTSQLHLTGSGTSHAGLNVHSILEDSTAMAENVGGLQVFEGTYISGSTSPAAFAAIHGGKENGTTSNYAGYLRFFTRANGSLPAEKLRLDSSGNLKITSEHLRFNTTGKGIIFGIDGGSNRPSIVGNYTSSSDNNIEFNTTGSLRMTLNSSGSLGIGLTPNSGQGILQISGGLKIAGSASASDTASPYIFRTSGANNMVFATGSNERMRLDEFGFLGLGADSPSGFSSAARNLVVSTSSGNCGLTINTGAADQIGSIFFAEGTGASGKGRIRYEHANNALAFSSDDSEAMRIDSSQRLLLGATSAYDTASGNAIVQIDGVGGASLAVTGNSTGSQTRISFFNPNGRVGFVSTDGSATVYNTSGSDKTLKKNFESWTENTLDLFKNINPQKFNYIHEDDGANKTKGFIAQEMVSSFPEAYTKEDKKDAKYYFNPSGMVVYLMKAIQELEAKVAALEAA